MEGTVYHVNDRVRLCWSLDKSANSTIHWENFLQTTAAAWIILHFKTTCVRRKAWIRSFFLLFVQFEMLGKKLQLYHLQITFSLKLSLIANKKHYYQY